MFGFDKKGQSQSSSDLIRDQDGDYLLGAEKEGLASGLASGTKVATTYGWCAVERINVGDKVLTFDAGMQEVVAITRGHLWRQNDCPPNLWPLYVPEGALGNAQPLLLLPEQSVMIESDVGEEIYGDPFTLIPSASLDGFRGIQRMAPAPDLESITLHFAQDQVVFTAAGGLLFCPSSQRGSVTDLLEGAPGDYTILDRADADFLVGCIAVDERHHEAEHLPLPGRAIV